MMPARNLSGKTSLIASFIAAAFSLFFLYTSGFGLISSVIHRGSFFLFTSLLCFTLYPARKRSPGERFTVIDGIFCLFIIAAMGYWILEFNSYMYREGNPTKMDLIAGVIIIVVSIETSRRVIGNVLPLLAGVFLLYAYFGPYVPGLFGHYGSSVTRTVEFVGFSMIGVFGIVVNTYATYIFPFVIFASFLAISGAGTAIEDFALALAGGRRGGPAKVAVVASGIIGSVTGASSANVVATGAYTIPLMKRIGYKPHIAAAVESAASTGAQFLPPIMGAAAFLIAAFTETPYLEVVKVSIIPALLYFLAVGFQVDFVAAREGLRGLPRKDLPRLGDLIIKKGYLLLPVPLLIFLIVVYSPQKAAFISTISTIVLSYLRKETRMSLRKIWDASVLAAKNSLVIASTGGVIGIIMGVVTMTGLGLKFPDFVISLSHGFLPITILLSAVAGYVLGMGVTITATYILLSILAVPALMELGVPLLTAHLTVFWFCEIGGLTPPVCILCFASSAIAECKPYKTAWTAIRLASPLFIIAFLLVYTPLLMNGPTVDIIATIVSSIIGMIAYAGMMQGYWLMRANLSERVVLGFGAFCLFHPNIYSDVLGVLLLAGLSFRHLKKQKKVGALEGTPILNSN